MNMIFDPYDYNIWVDWTGVSPFDIKHSKSYTDKQKDNTKKALRELQVNIYNDTIDFFPQKNKVKGGYISTWYDYPSIQVGYNSIKFFILE